jgi:hypothetical protein
MIMVADFAASCEGAAGHWSWIGAIPHLLYFAELRKILTVPLASRFGP